MAALLHFSRVLAGTVMGCHKGGPGRRPLARSAALHEGMTQAGLETNVPLTRIQTQEGGGHSSQTEG